MRRFLMYWLMLGCLSGFALSAPRAQAATLTVTNLNDSTAVNGCTSVNSGDGCTLREAITDANADSGTTDTITFAPGINGGTITLATALPDITTPLSILNPAAQTIALARSTDANTPSFNILVVYASGNDKNPNTAPTGPSVALQGLTLTGGVSADGPGQFRGGGGGGLYVENGTVSLSGCTLSGNAGSYLGGGLLNNGGAVTCTNSTVAGNTAGKSGYGGGIFVLQGTLALTNSTVAGNTSGIGGGVHIDGGTVTLSNCTITRNTTNNQGSGIEFFTGGTVTLNNTIVAGNSNSDLDAASGGVYSSGGYNLIGSSVTGSSSPFTQTGDAVNTNAANLKLGLLQDNGGPTQTIALGMGSLAIDRGNTTLTTDQRGVARPFGGADDVGAYEYNGTPSFVVTTLTDEDDGNSEPTFGTGTGTSLREAINAANFYVNTPQTITFAPGLVGQTITLTRALPDITSGLSISNPAAQTITVARSTDANTAKFSILRVVGNGVDQNPDLPPTGPTVALRGLTLLNGAAQKSSDGGVSLSRTGGGLYAQNSTVTLISCALSGATGFDYGGGLFSYDSTVTFTNCTVNDNSAGFGGGIYNYFGVIALTNSTVTNNAADSSGGGICNQGGPLTLNSCTVARNTASGSTNQTSGGLYLTSGSTTLSNSIVAANINSDIYAEANTSFNSITTTSGGYNLVGVGNASALTPFTKTGDKTGVTAAQVNLGPFQNNGGPTQTISLLFNSIALDAGNPNTADLPATDQRGEGFPRVFNGRADVGAYEAQFVSLKGRVYNATGRSGLSGIIVNATTGGSNGTSPILTTTRTGEGGNYVLPLEVGTYTISVGGRFRPSFTNPVQVTVAGAGSLSYDFRAIGIGGRVINPNNVGVAGVTLSLEGVGTSTTQLSDADGFFSFDVLAAGDYTLTPSGSSNMVFTPTSRALTLADTPLFTSFKATTKITYALAGSITSNGQSVEGVQVTATRASDGKTFTTRTGKDGSYAFSTLTGDRYTVAAQAPGLVFTYAPTPNQPQPLVLTANSPSKSGINFAARRVITGTVYNAVALQGLRGMTVTAVRSGDGRTSSVTTDDTGVYRLELGTGTYTLTARNPYSSAFRFITSFTNPLSIVVSGTGTQTNGNAGYNFRSIGIGGRIVNASNQGISHISLNAYYEGNNKPSRGASTDANGFFSLDGLLPGNWTVYPVTGTYTYTPFARFFVVQDQPLFTSFRASAPSNSGRSVGAGARSPVTLSVASADAQAGTLSLKFTGQLDAVAASELSHYAVQVNGVDVSVASATLTNGGDTIVLTLPSGALTKGSQVQVSWNGVLDAQGLPLRGTEQVRVS